MKIKRWYNIFHVIANENSILQLAIKIQKRNNDKCQCECKKYRTCKKDNRWNPSTCVCVNGKCLKSISHTSVIV